jgi:hypothetical protein
LASVVFGNKEVDNSEEIFSELFVWGLVCTLHVNHEFGIGLGKDEFDQLESVAAESVATGNAHFSDSAAVDSVQKGTKFGTIVVEATADFRDDFVIRIRLAEVVGLPLEIGSLLGTADSCIADFRFASSVGSQTE